MTAPTHATATRRRLLGMLATAGLLTATERLGLIRAALAAGANPVPPGLHRIRGAVTVNGRPAREGQLVRPGDTVVTGAGAEALYVIGQDAFLQRESSTVSFGDDVAGFMRVVTGKLLSVFGKGQRSLTVATATIGIRGTACYIEQEARRTYFCLCYGEAEVVPLAAPAQREIIRTRYHDHPLYIHQDPRMQSMMAKAPVINHSDAELVMLENLVGRQPVFVGSGHTGY